MPHPVPHSVAGSTKDFGSFSLGSNPGGAAKKSKYPYHAGIFPVMQPNSGG